MKRAKDSIDLSMLGPELATLRALGGDAMMHEALAIARERLALTPEKLALLIVRAVAPDELIGETEESRLRGCSPVTLRAMKERGDVRRVVNS